MLEKSIQDSLNRHHLISMFLKNVLNHFCVHKFYVLFLFRFIKLLEKKGRLLRNYTQNIDTLEQVVGIENVIECHGKIIYLNDKLIIADVYEFL